MIDVSELEKRFNFHPAKDDQPIRYQTIRRELLRLSVLIGELCPDSREKSLAITKLEEVGFWANASIARNE